MTQEEMKQSMVKDCIEIVDDKNVLDLEMRLGYFELRLYQLDILEIDKLFESCWPDRRMINKDIVGHKM